MSGCPRFSSPDCAGICNGHSLLDCSGECYDPLTSLPPHIHDCAGECYLSSLPAPHFLNTDLQCVTNDTICPNPPCDSCDCCDTKKLDELPIISRLPVRLWILLVLLIAMTILVFLAHKKNKKS